MADDNTKINNVPKATFDNQIRTVGTTSGKAVEAVLFGADQVFVGVENANETEIATNKVSGLKYERNKVEGVEIYNLHKQAHHCWLMIDLETGGRGWYPGSKEVVDVNNAIMYTSADDTSTIIETITEAAVFDKLDLVYGPCTETSKQIVYCKVQKQDSSGTIGYIKNSKVVKTRYVDRT